MKVLLVRPPSFKMPIVIPNLGLGYLTSILKKNQHAVWVLDCAKERMTHEGFQEYLKEVDPDIVGIQVFTCDFTSSRYCLDLVKQFNRDIITLIGGPHPSGDPGGIMEDFIHADFAFRGEAEIGLPKLLKYLEGPNGTKLKEVEGLVFREDGRIQMNERGCIKNLDDIPFPSWDLINPCTYPPAPHGTFSRSLPIAPLITTRGCPYDCAYCAVKVTCGKNFRKRTVSNILEEIKYLQREFGVKEIHVEDDNFTLSKPRVLEFCEGIQKENIKITLALPNGVRLDTLDEEILASMEKAGFYSFAVGVESGSQRIIEEMKRDIHLETVIEKVKLVSAVSRIRMTGFFIMGYPSETEEDLEKTIALSLKLPLHRAQFSNFLPFPGTPIYEKLKEKREIDHKTIPWDLYQDNKIVYSPSGISREKLRRLMRKAFRKFYFRLSILSGLIKEIHSWRQLRIVLWRMIDVFK